MTNIILCGGNGTRLWPISRENMPKQFLKMFDDKSLYQLTLLRNRSFSNRTIIVSNAAQYFLAQDQTHELRLDGHEPFFVVEAIGRNTAAAIAFGAFLAPEDILFVTPSDHLIENEQKYAEMIEYGLKAAQNDALVTFGIIPTKPETGYGYIQAKKESTTILDVIHFKEKPDLQTAKNYLQANEDTKSNSIYLWNSGMFMFKASVYLQELQKHAPTVYKTAKSAFENAQKDDFIRLKSDDMLSIPDISIDYALMEKSSNIKVIKSEIKWNDVGSFDALDEVFEKDKNQNTKLNNLFAYNSHNNFVFGRYKTIALNEVNDLVIVDTPSALLVGKKGSSQKVREIVKMLKDKNPQLVQYGRTVYKPWGKFTNLHEDKRFKVKTLVVKPGKRLSLQKHFHRSEHWVVVKGTALVQIEEKEFLLRSNESTFIPMGAKHRLSNPGKVPLEVVEVQVGEYLGEDDIVRLQDDYGRIKDEQ
ncbi:mannose-1-phosphate guanylyltransferase/mannose-6-phosphate isomerase [Nitratiruptor sp. SB155-2]|uniref:mannose-1-phosphate guanylyltransferase/mannose-6-phosphate isomerase n=1 Tax=Nitratiruptor sp. (strain SB155-2) TaxID=387092 RepID=UPI0001586D10|nr:mannose-1-phosphate guanylyltransferase/mannose-6-phosphate isomerase [Nitratiruptor sp. SB155-2]BAF69309.1 mannose-1-phosphate guanylyltransferase [Nitratiruptor sp. SB155-2]